MYKIQRNGEEHRLLSVRGPRTIIYPHFIKISQMKSEEQHEDSSVRVLEGFRDIEKVGYRVRGGGENYRPRMVEWYDTRERGNQEIKVCIQTESGRRG